MTSVVNSPKRIKRTLNNILNPPSDLASGDHESFILDGREISLTSLVKDIPALHDLLKMESLSQLWLSLAEPQFHEVRQRLIDRSERDPRFINDSIFKLSRLSKDIEEDDHIRDSDEMRFIGKTFGNVDRFDYLCRLHPGWWNHSKRACAVNVNSRWKNNKAISKRKLDEEVSSYDDKRRPKKSIIVELKSKLLSSSFKNESSATEDDINYMKGSENIKQCYMCKIHKVTNHVRICDNCEQINLEMRIWRVDLSGYVAIVTGARIKIGFETAVRLLRNGCEVVATSRFPRDALLRYQQLSDWEVLKGRLRIVEMNFLNLHTVSEFLDFFEKEYTHLEILINNAAQTIHRGKDFYDPMIEKEKVLKLHQENDKDKKTLVPALCANNIANNALEFFPTESGVIMKEDPVDESSRNSWTLNLNEVPLSELLEVLAINTIGPFLLTSKLKSKMVSSPFPRRFVVNVSAMEGQFSRYAKGHRHPHTNMAKAALNMMSRTSGMEYLLDEIYMTSVDTGWVTDERPLHQATYEKDVRGFKAPLSEEDGAARILHPVFHGLSLAKEVKEKPHFAVFLKDFKPYPW